MHYTIVEWETLLLCTGGRCVACGDNGPMTVDHIVPLSRAGSNTIDNIQPLCKPCNSQKHTQTINYLAI